MKRVLAGMLAGFVFAFAVLPVIIVPAAVEVTKKVVERAAECAAGYIVTGPAHLLVNGVEMSVGLVDGAFGAGKDLIDFGAGIFGVGGDDGFKWEEEQLHIAANFLSVGLTYVNHPDEQQRIGERELISILAAGLAESEMENVPHGTDTSVGVLQLLDIHGSFAERMDLEFQARWYFDTLLLYLPTPADRDAITIGEIAATVERPAKQYEYRYDTRVEEATAMYEALSPSLSGTLAIVGSSTTQSYQSQLVDYVEDAGWQTVLFDAASDRTIEEAVPIVDEWQDEYEPTLWIFDLGEADLTSVTSVAEASALIELLQDPLPDDAKQVWVTLDDPDSTTDEIFNESLAIFDAQTANFNLVPWANYSAANQASLWLNGQITSDALEQRAAMIGRVAVDPVSFGFDESELGDGGGGFELDLPDACQVGESVIGFAKGSIGAVFNPVDGAKSFLGTVFGDSGIEIPEDEQELLELAEEVDATQIQPGDLIVFPPREGTDDLLFGDRAVYLGGSEMIREPEAGQVVYVERVDWTDEFTVLRIEIQVEIDSDIEPITYNDTVEAAGFRVHPDLQRPVERLMQAAERDGIVLGGGGWRSIETTIELRRAHCGTSHYAVYEMPSLECTPPTAQPGRSMHERGLAIDFTCDGVLIMSQDNRCFIWLAANAGPIAGLQNFEVEPWHWSTNGR